MTPLRERTRVGDPSQASLRDLDDEHRVAVRIGERGPAARRTFRTDEHKRPRIDTARTDFGHCGIQIRDGLAAAGLLVRAASFRCPDRGYRATVTEPGGEGVANAGG